MFRRGYDPLALVMRTIALCFMLGVYYMVPADGPREKMDQSWLVSFCVVMLVYIIALHGFAYFATDIQVSCRPCFENASALQQMRPSR